MTIEACLDLDSAYDGIEATIHMCRYGFVKALCEDKQILDVACGRGYGTALMSRWGASQVTGIDISASAIADAERLFASERARFVCADAEHLSELFNREEFDLVVSFETIEHIADPRAFLGEIRKAIKPAGAVIISCPNDWWHYPGEHERNPYHQKKYRFEEFRILAEEELGPADCWFLGAATAGFCNVAADEIHECGEGDAQLRMFDYHPMPALLLPAEPGKAPRAENASYFIGVWGEVAMSPGAALLPYGMDAFNQGFFHTVSLAEVTRLKSELARVRAALVEHWCDNEGIRGAPLVDTDLKQVPQHYASLVIDALLSENDLLRAHLDALQANQATFQSQIQLSEGSLRDAKAELDMLRIQTAELEMLRQVNEGSLCDAKAELDMLRIQTAELESLRVPAERYRRLLAVVPRPLLTLLRHLHNVAGVSLDPR
jgi:SAM-dependent methyltransferase